MEAGSGRQYCEDMTAARVLEILHKSLTMTQRYTHLRDEALRTASDPAGGKVQRASQPERLEPVLKLATKEG